MIDQIEVVPGIAYGVSDPLTLSLVKLPLGPLAGPARRLQPALRSRSDLLPLWSQVHSALEPLTALTVEICEISAPTFEESTRGDHVSRYLEEISGQVPEQDDVGNRWIRIKGSQGDGPCILASAHLDTVFPAATDCSVRSENGRLIGPGIGDNCSGLSILLYATRLLFEAGLPFPGELIVATNTGEEGLGNLNGMRALCERLQGTLDGALALDGSLGHVVGAAVGSLRYRVSVTGPGGHSWSDFGKPSALHIIAKMASALADMEVTEQPRTTFNVGSIQGGTSINSIAEQAELLLDLRSVDPAALVGLDARAHRAIGSVPLPEGVTLDIKRIGERPTGPSELTGDWVDIARATWEILKVPLKVTASSTDANIPIAMGLKASTLGTCRGGRVHTTSEWIDPATLPKGLEAFLLTLLSALELFSGKKEQVESD